MANKHVGFIGLGNMGGGMALRLLERGVQLTVYDRRAEAVDPLRKAGAAAVNSPREVADAADIVFASLPSLDASMAVALGSDGVVHGKAIKVYVETSTLGTTTVAAIDKDLSAAGKGFLGVPVSGGPLRARDGTLSALASGAKPAFDIVRATLDLIATNVFYLSEQADASQIAKLINNHVSSAGRLAVLEGLAMAEKSGIDLKVMNDVFNASSGRNYTITHKVPAAILTGSFAYNGPLTIALKDEALLLEEAARRGIPLWIAPRVLETFREAAAAGYRDKDGMRVYQYMHSQTCEPSDDIPK